MYPSRIFTFICLLLSPFLMSAQEFQLQGRVSILNSRVENGPIKYIKDVKISNELSPTRITDNKGRFELNFIDQDPNSMTNLKVALQGYEVVNKDVLNDIQISNNGSVRIFLAKKGLMEEMESGLLKFSQAIILERKDSIFYLLNRKPGSNEDIVKELERNFGQKISDEMEAKLLLNQAIQEVENELPSLVHQVATVNLDFASDRYKKAISLFQENKLNQAIETLDGNKLYTSFRNTLASIEKAKESPESFQKVRNTRSIQIENVIESFELKRTLLKLVFRIVEAEELNEKIARMKTLHKESQSPLSLKNNNTPEYSMELGPAVNILLDDTMHLALIDTNWVEMEMESLISKGAAEEELTGDPKANTILETLPKSSGVITLGIDFENTLLVNKQVEPYEVPIYEQPTPVLISKGKVTKSGIIIPFKAKPKEKKKAEWSDFAKAIDPKDAETLKPSSQSKKEIKKEIKEEIKKVIPKPEEIDYDEVIEPIYTVYKITKKTSLRQKATASSKVLKRLNVGTEVKVIDQVDRYWCKVILNGKEGYVKVLLLERAN